MRRVTACVLLSSLAIFLLPVMSFAQILNGGFEQWTGNTPDHWSVNNAEQLYVPVTQSNTSHSGSYALKGEVVNFLSTPWPPIILSGDDGTGFPVSAKYLSLEGFYQFTPIEGDVLIIAVTMSNSGNFIGTGALEISNSASAYTPFAVGIYYPNPEFTPDTVWIEIIVTNHSTETDHIGTQFLIDDLSLSMNPTSVETANSVLPSTILLNQNYPNPFNPSTTIGFSLPRNSEVTLTVYDVSGKVVDKLINRQNMAAGYHSMQWKPNTMLPSGAYFYNLEAGTFTQSKRMLFIK